MSKLCPLSRYFRQPVDLRNLFSHLKWCVLLHTLQTRFQEPIADLFGGVGGGGGGGSGGDAAAAAPEPVKVKDVFDIKLTEVDAKAKIKIIKEVRAITGLGLKEVSLTIISSPVGAVRADTCPVPLFAG